MSVPQVQLPLEVRLRAEATFDNFCEIDGAEPVIDALRRQPLAGGEPLLFLSGMSGAGKSHLLQACCHEQEAACLYLPLADLVEYPAQDVLQATEHLQRLCCDDVHAVAGNEDWELGLFHLINRCRQSGCRLVFAAQAPPRALAISLPDLASRLAGGVVYPLPRPGDSEKTAILSFRAERLGLELSAPEARFIVNRAPRKIEQLLDILDTLDRASLAQQRQLSIPFIKATLGW